MIRLAQQEVAEKLVLPAGVTRDEQNRHLFVGYAHRRDGLVVRQHHFAGQGIDDGLVKVHADVTGGYVQGNFLQFADFLVVGPPNQIHGLQDARFLPNARTDPRTQEFHGDRGPA